MSRTLKKLLSLLLCAVLLFGSVAVGSEGVGEILSSFSIRASAATQLNVTQQEAVNWVLANYKDCWDFDSSYGVQCVDLVKWYCRDCLGINIGSIPNPGYAYQIDEMTTVKNNFTILYSGTPQAGDIFVWDPGVNGCGYTGHTGIVVTSGSTYQVVDWNWISGTYREPASYSAYSYLVRPQFKSAHTCDYKASATITKAPTRTEAGTRVRTCSCGKTDTQTIPAIPYTTDLAEGIYTITSKNKEGLRIASNDTQNYNVFAWNNPGNDCYWLFRKNSDGTYTIESAYFDGYVLDVVSGKMVNGANIQIYQSNGTDAQKFYVIPDGNYYRLVVKKSYLTVDLHNGETNDGTNIKQWEDNGGSAQRWAIELNNPSLTLSATSANLTAGGSTTVNCTINREMYGKTISYSISDSSVCSASWGSWNGMTRPLTITGKADGTATINLTLQDEETGTVYNTKTISVTIHTCDYAASATITKAPTRTETGTRVRTCSCGKTDTQTIPAIPYTTDLAEGIYTITTKCKDGMRIATTSWSNYNVFIAPAEDPDQYWLFRKNSDGTYTIENAYHNGKVLDVYANLKVNGANIQAYDYNGTDAQKFYVIPDGDYYKLVVKGSYLNVDLHKSNTNNGTNIKQWQANDSDAQLWALKLCNPPLNMSTTSVTISKDSFQTVNCVIGRETYGTTISLSNSNPSVCSADWGDSSGMTRPLTITAQASGTATITLTLKDTNTGIVYDTKTITVTVPNNCTVSFNANGGSCSTVSKTVTCNSTYGTLPTPTRTGYSFAGWYTASSGGTQITASSTVSITASQTLYAQWIANPPVVNPATGSGTVVDKSTHFIYGLSVGAAQGCVAVTDGTAAYEYPTARQAMGTGTKVNVYNNDNELVDSYTVVVFGDIDGDSWYDGTDAYFVRLVASGMVPSTALTDAQRTACDANHDGAIDAADVALIEKAGLLLNQIDQNLPQEELQTNSVYLEYCGLIDQTLEITEADPPSTAEEAPTAAEGTPTRSVLAWIKALFTIVLNWLLRIF